MRFLEISTDFCDIFRFFIFFAERTKIFRVIYPLIILAAKGPYFLCTYQLHSFFCQNQVACFPNI